MIEGDGIDGERVARTRVPTGFNLILHGNFFNTTIKPHSLDSSESCKQSILFFRSDWSSTAIQSLVSFSDLRLETVILGIRPLQQDDSRASTQMGASNELGGQRSHIPRWMGVPLSTISLLTVSYVEKDSSKFILIVGYSW